MDNFILEIPNVISKDLCKEMIELFENDNRKIEGSIFIGNNRFVVIPTMKKSSDLKITPLKEWSHIDEKIFKCVSNSINIYIDHLLNTFNCKQDIHPLASLQNAKLIDGGYCISKISKGGDYKWHYDGELMRKNPSYENVAVMNIIIYLNDLTEEDGGYTSFWGGKRIAPEAGKAVIFPTTWTFIHSGEKVKTEKAKYICATSIFPSSDSA